MRSIAWRLCAWASTIVVVLLCLVPGDELKGASALDHDKALHALAFAFIGFAWRRSGLGRRRTLILGLVLALGTELAQAWFVHRRHGDPLDVLADVVGLCVGVFLAGVFQARADVQAR